MSYGHKFSARVIIRDDKSCTFMQRIELTKRNGFQVSDLDEGSLFAIEGQKEELLYWMRTRFGISSPHALLVPRKVEYTMTKIANLILQCNREEQEEHEGSHDFGAGSMFADMIGRSYERKRRTVIEADGNMPIWLWNKLIVQRMKPLMAHRLGLIVSERDE